MTARGGLILRRLAAHRLPGIPDGFTVATEPGVNLVLGPNESGKSSLVRSVFQLLWDDTPVIAPCALDAEFAAADGTVLRAVLATGEKTAWSRDGEPTAPPAVPSGHLAHCYHLGLLDLNRRAADDVDRDLARQVQRQMAGGYDLPAVRNLFPDRSRQVQARRRDWQAAEQDALAVGRTQRALAQEVHDLDGLRAELEAAQAAARHRSRLAAALAHHAAAARLADLRLQRDALPAGTDRVRSGDDETLENLAARLRSKTRTARQLRDALAARRERLDAIAVGDGLPEARLLVQAATDADRAAAEADKGVAAARKAVAAREAELPPELRDAGAGELPADAVARLRRAHAASLEPAADLAAVERLLEEEIFRAADSAPSLSGSVLWPLAAVLVAAAGVVLVLRDLAAAGLPALAAGLLLLGAWWSTRNRRRVVARLREGLEHRAARSRETRQEADARRADLHRKLGGQGDPAAPDFVADLDRLDRYHAARADLDGAEGACDAARSARDAALEAASAALAGLGEAGTSTIPALQAALDILRGREAEHRAALETQASDEAALADAEADIAEAAAEQAALLTRLDLPALSAAAPDSAPEFPAGAAGLTDQVLHAVQERLDARDAWERLDADIAAAEHERKLARRQLEDLPAGATDDTAELLATSPADLEQRVAAAETGAEQVADLIARIADIEGRARAARAGRAWESARAQADAAAAALDDALAEQRAGLFGNLVLDAVEQRHAADHRTPLLTAADAHLDLFTGGRYRLRLAASDSGDGFAVLDPGNRARSLSALSDGTRAQVLLAARLAFLTGTESDGSLPLFLDEALTASDPERFDAIAGALGRLAADTGRQVFYLTSNPADVAAWQRALADRDLPAAHLVDLAAARGQASAAPADALVLEPLPTVPQPGELSAADYGARLGVAPVQPWNDAAHLDLFHLWRDDLELVHTLARGRVRTVGQWRRLGPALVQAGLVPAHQQERIDGRVAVWSAWQEGWRIGRGRPVTPEVLVASDALTAVMLAPACDVLAAARGDAQDFMARVEAGEVKRLRADKKNALREHLEGEGHLDRRDVLDEAGLLGHVLESVAPRLRAGTLDHDEVRDLVAALTSAAEASV